MNGWIGVDLDGTLAYWDDTQSTSHIGEPIPAMMNRVRKWLREGREVKIFTARAADPEQVALVRRWLTKHALPLEVTNRKDWRMVQLWDDRAVSVEMNTGMPKVLAE